MPTGTRLAGRAEPVARPFARHKQSTGLFMSGLNLRYMRRLCTDSSRSYLGRSALLGGEELMGETAGLCRTRNNQARDRGARSQASE